MPADGQSVFCAKCGLAIDEDPGLPVEERKPCPSCGSTARNIHVTINETVTMREKLGLKGRHPGGKKPFIEQVSGDDLHRKSGKWMIHSRVIDRDNDSYHEVVMDPTNDKIVHECKEPLSQHRGHGSAKRKRMKMKYYSIKILAALFVMGSIGGGFIVGVQYGRWAGWTIFIVMIAVGIMLHKTAEINR
ncbi:MAG TPA: hypothetical protein VJ440_02365 [Candidatus Brocadiaceae bacterium]|nr:hypothetical protein [Candidatus Brocadiaceae bacterium]